MKRGGDKILDHTPISSISTNRAGTYNIRLEGHCLQINTAEAEDIIVMLQKAIARQYTD